MISRRSFGGNTLRLLLISAAVSGAHLSATPDPVGQIAVTSGETIIDYSVTATGDGFVASSPNSTGAHRNAVIVGGDGAVLTLASGANLVVQNDNNLTAFLRVGYFGEAGTLNIASGATLAVGSDARYANFIVGEGAGANGVVNQTGGSVTVKGSFDVGQDGGTGAYNISSGTLTLTTANNATNHTSLATIGLNLNAAGSPASNGALNISGGTVVVTAGLWNGTDYGTMNLILGNRDSGASSYGDGNGSINQTAGTLHVDNQAQLFLSSVGNGTYNLTGGALEIGGASLQTKYGNGAGTYAFNFGGAAGATIRVIGSDLTTSANVTLNTGATNNITSIVDTNGFNATFSGNLTAPGLHQVDFGGNSFVKTGLGTLNLSGVNSLDSAFVTGGTLHIAGGSTSAVEFGVGSGTGAIGAVVMDGGSFTINNSTKTDNTTPVVGAFRVGDFGGTGTFTQNAGTVTVNGSLNIGNQGGSGVYNLNGGALTLIDGLDVIGRSQTGKPSSQGVLNITAGTLTLQNTNLVIGNEIRAAAGTSSVINQSGGTLHVDATSGLFLSGVTAGAYNLTGGALEAGGISLSAQFTNSSPGYAFNFGGASGATIRVIGSSLTTSANVTLNTGATNNVTATIDTNGFGAAFSGNITAPGLHQVDFGGDRFIKTGLGTLTLSGTNALDSAFVTGGSLQVSGGSTSAVEFAVGSGSGSTGSFLLSGGSFTINNSTKADNTTFVAGSFRVGDYGGTGTFTQNAGTVLVNGSLNIGNQAGSGTYTLAGGSLTLDGGLNVIGRSQGSALASQGVLNISGGLLTLQDTSTLVIGNDVRYISGSSSVINQTGGTLHVNGDSNLFLAGFTDGHYNLTGGALEIGGASLHTVRGGSPAYDFNLGGASGATIRVVGSALTTAANITLNTGATDNVTATIDTNGFGAAFSGNITAPGLHQVDFGGDRFIKTGLGTLTLSGTNSLDSAFVTGGSLQVSGGSTSAVEFAVGSGSGATGSFLLSGGSFTINNSTKADNTTFVAGSFRVGDYGGTGTFTQNAGTVLVNGSLNIGNQAGSGTYTLAGGSLILDGGLNVIARSQGSALASQGVLNISGGLLTLQDTSTLVIGNDVRYVSGSSSVINQTGGTLHVNGDSNLFLAGFTDGHYNLTGGALEIGGASLHTVRGGSPAYDFNLGGASGATIRVVGSTLTTAANITLNTGATNNVTATIDTNGFGAAFSGNITAPGLHLAASGGNTFVKTGAGTLTLTGTNKLDSASVTGGSIKVSGGSTSAGELVAGAGTSGTFLIDGGSLAIVSTTLTDNATSVAGSLRIGEAGGTGTFTQSGGAVSIASGGSLIIGNLGGSGTYNLQAGTLTLNAGSHVIGGSDISGAASQGTLNVSGGTLTLTGGGSLFVGNDVSNPHSGFAATIAQTGGTLHVDNDSALYLSAYTAGSSYNLSGGTLEIGGSSLQATYNGTGDGGHFNLGGGTLKVTGSDLTTAARPVFVASTTSTIDVNGLNASFTNGFSGSGNVNLQGAGKVSATGDLSGYTGRATVGSGTTFSVATSATPAVFNGSVTVNSGGTLSGYGAFLGAVSISGSHSLGGVPGSQTFLGGLAYHDAAVSLLFGPSSFDTISVFGGLSITGNTTLSLARYGVIDYSDSYWNVNRTFELYDVQGGITGAFVFDDAALEDGVEDRGAWTLEQTGNEVSAKWTTATAVPEPATYGLVTGGVMAAVALIRRRKRSKL